MKIRTAILVALAALLAAAMFLRGWGHAELDRDTSIQIGLRSAWECDLEFGCRAKQLRELDKIDEAGESEAGFALVCGVLAIGAIAIAAGLSRGATRTPLGVRLGLAAICGVSAIASIVFAERLGRLRWLDTGWAPYVALGAALGAATAIVADRREPAA